MSADVMPEAEQLARAHHHDPKVRIDLATRSDLHAVVQELLARDGDDRVLHHLTHDQHIDLAPHVQVLLAQAALDRDWTDPFFKVQIDRLGEAGQLYLVRSGRMNWNQEKWLASQTTHASVQLALLPTGPADLLSNKRVLDAQVWTQLTERVISATTSHSDRVIVRAAAGVNFGVAPKALLDFLHAMPDESVLRILVDNPTAPLRTSMPVHLLTASPRGRDFLEGFAPLERSTWDALVGTWLGDVPSLLGACSVLAPERASTREAIEAKVRPTIEGS